MQNQRLTIEKTLLGSCLADPESCVNAVGVVRPSDFSNAAHEAIWACLVECFENGDPVSALSVSEILAEKNLLDSVGGRTYVTDLSISGYLSPAQVPYYSRLLRGYSVADELQHLALEIQERQNANGFEALEFVQNEVFRLSQDEQQVTKTIHDYREEALAHREKINRGDFSDFVSTGLPSFDRLTHGLGQGRLIVVAARPGMGKTTLAINWAAHAAYSGTPILFHTLEMSGREIVDKLLTREARSLHGLGLIEIPEHFVIDDRGALNLIQLQASIQKTRIKYPKLGMVVVDYLQLMDGEGENQNLKISSLSRGLKRLAKKFNLPVVCLSQLNRGVETRQDKRPVLSDLRDSGSIEQDADLVVLNYRDEYYNPHSDKAGTIDLLVAKHRHGPTGLVTARFDGETSRIWEG